jgi:hypothetical protein
MTLVPVFLRHNAVVFILLSLLTLGNAYPYAVAYRDYAATKTCCPCCHEYEARHTDRSLHDRTERRNYDFNPCGKPSNRYAAAFVTESFLMPADLPFSLPALIGPAPAPAGHVPDSVKIVPPLPPPIA